MASTRAAQAERTRRSVLEHASVLFGQRGYDSTSLQDIADAMGIRKANVYYYFRAKEDILAALLDERIAALEAMFVAASGIANRHERQAAMIDGFVTQVVIAHRTVAPVDFADPGVRRHPTIAPRLDALTEQGLHLFFDSTPTVDEEAGFLMLLDLKPVLRRFTGLPDSDLADVLRRLCRRLIPD